MEGNNGHGYLEEDVSYDDLINAAGWPSSTDQYTTYPQSPAGQASYAPYAAPQPTYDHYGLSQQSSYPPASYSNSPYASQYQHARPSDVFGPSSYNLDPALQRSAAYHGPESSFSSFGLHGTDSANATISPHSLQYNMVSTQPSINRGLPNLAFQRPASDFRQQPQDHAAVYFSNTQSGNLQTTEGSTRYSAFSNAF